MKDGRMNKGWGGKKSGMYFISTAKKNKRQKVRWRKMDGGWEYQ